MRDNAVWKYRLLYLDSFDETYQAELLKELMHRRHVTRSAKVMLLLTLALCDSLLTSSSSWCICDTSGVTWRNRLCCNNITFKYLSAPMQFGSSSISLWLQQRMFTVQVLYYINTLHAMSHCCWIVTVRYTSRTYLTFNFTKFWSSVNASGSLFSWLSWTFEQGKYQNLF